MEDANFNFDKRLTQYEIQTIFNNMQNDLAMLVDENLTLLKSMIPKEVSVMMKDLANTIDSQLEKAKSLYSVLGDETVDAQSFMKFLDSLQGEMKKDIASNANLVIFGVSPNEQITLHTFFDIFINLIFMMQVGIIMGESFEAKIDAHILNIEYEKMKREGLI